MPSLDDLAGNPAAREMVLSPDGLHVAYFRRQNEKDLVVVQNIIDGQILGVTVLDKNKPSRLLWAGNRNVIIISNKTQWRRPGGGGPQKAEVSHAFAYSLDNQQIHLLLDRKSKYVYRGSTAMGNVIAVDAQNGGVFIPAFDSGGNFNLLYVSLADAEVHMAQQGVFGGIQWVLGPGNQIIARAISMPDQRVFALQTLSSATGDDWNTIFQQKVDGNLPFDIAGIASDGQHLVLHMMTGTLPFASLFLMDLTDGTIEPDPYYHIDGIDLDTVIRDPYTNKVVGVSWIQDTTKVHYFDSELQRVHNVLQAALPGKVLEIVNWSENRQRFLVQFADPGRPGIYGIYDLSGSHLTVLAPTRPTLERKALGNVNPWSYNARDGLPISAYLTLPPGKKDAKGLPLIVLPHGGPEARDSVEYDWMAQVFATRGYAVFQPNFRGSSGYGMNFTRAGWGEWGKAMQDDITDGVNKLISDGVADPKRICIVGASYGGYAALAGGAFTPDIYQCVVSIAGVSDLHGILSWEQNVHGRNSWGSEYWERFMLNDAKRSKPALQAVSPAQFADRFNAPVLLIHGKDDTVVPIQQSRIMERALRKAGKNVTLIEEKSGDHWMSYESTRLKTARAMLDFVQANIGDGTSTK